MTRFPKSKVGLVVLLLLWFAAGPVLADRCDSVLQNGTFGKQQIEKNDYARLVFSARLASMTASEARRKIAASGGAPIDGIPLSGNFSDDEFSKFQQWVRKSVDVDSIESHQSSATFLTGDPTIINAWENCMSRSGGLSVTIRRQGSRLATFEMKWWPTTGTNGAPTVKSFTVRGGTVVGGEIWTQPGSNLGTAANRIVTIEHPQNQDVLVTVSTDFDDESAFLSRPLPVGIVEIPKLKIGSCVGHGGAEGVHFWGPHRKPCNALPPPGWGLYDTDVREVTQIGSCVGRGGVPDIHFYGPPGALCAGEQGWGPYENPENINPDNFGFCIAGLSALQGHVLWGPKGEVCGGISTWGTYN
jgi:hypothetical protein